MIRTLKWSFHHLSDGPVSWDQAERVNCRVMHEIFELYMQVIID